MVVHFCTTTFLWIQPMRLMELLLSKQSRDKDLPADNKQKQKLDMLKQNVKNYADRLTSPDLKPNDRSLLKQKLQQAKEQIKELTEKLKEDETQTKYEVYDRQTGAVVGGPYSTRVRASRAVDRLDNKYGGYRYGHRPIAPNKVNEAVRTVPLTDNQFDELKERMSNAIPAEIAAVILSDVLETDDLSDEFIALAENNPNHDVRPLVVQWMELNMPDQMYRFNNKRDDIHLKHGTFSPLHGYPPKDS